MTAVGTMLRRMGDLIFQMERWSYQEARQLPLSLLSVPWRWLWQENRRPLRSVQPPAPAQPSKFTSGGTAFASETTSRSFSDHPAACERPGHKPEAQARERLPL